jgi:uncharacterized membrane protein
MNPWLRGLEIATSAIAVAASVLAFGTLVVILLKRRRIEELIRTRPPRKLPKYRWIGVAVGAALLVAFEFVVIPHLLPRLSLRYHITVSIVGVLVYVALTAAFFTATQRMQSWPVPARLRTMYILLAAACILAVAGLFHVFS